MSNRFAIQPVRPEDVPAVVSMVHELADYERAADECHLTVDDRVVVGEHHRLVTSAPQTQPATSA